jgi:hypothetical protein
VLGVAADEDGDVLGLVDGDDDDGLVEGDEEGLVEGDGDGLVEGDGDGLVEGDGDGLGDGEDDDDEEGDGDADPEEDAEEDAEAEGDADEDRCGAADWDAGGLGSTDAAAGGVRNAAADGPWSIEGLTLRGWADAGGSCVAGACDVDPGAVTVPPTSGWACVAGDGVTAPVSAKIAAAEAPRSAPVSHTGADRDKRCRGCRRPRPD